MSEHQFGLRYLNKLHSKLVYDPALAENQRAIFIPVRATNRDRNALLNHLGRFQTDYGDLLWDTEMREQSGFVFAVFNVWLLVDLNSAGVARVRQASGHLYQFMIDHACCRLEAIFYQWHRDKLLDVLERLEQSTEPLSVPGLEQQSLIG